MQNLTQAIKAIAPNAAATNNITATRTQPDTIAEARAKVIAKLHANIDYVKKGMNAATSKKPDLVFKHNARADTYSVGVKYGNRWISNLADTGEKHYKDIERGELVSVLELLSEHVNAGHVDAGIEAIQRTNLAARRAA